MSCIIASSIPKEFSVTSSSVDVQGQVVETCAKGGDSRKVTFDNCQNCTINYVTVTNFTIDGGGGN